MAHYKAKFKINNRQSTLKLLFLFFFHKHIHYKAKLICALLKGLCIMDEKFLS